MPSSLPRLELTDFPAALAASLEPRVKRLGYLGEFFKCAAHHPQALAAFNALTEASQEGLPDRLIEVIALTCSVWMGNDYEGNQRERLCIRQGFGRDWVAAVNALKPEVGSVLSGEERSIQRLTLAVLETRGKGAAALFEDVVHNLGPRSAMAILMVIGRYAAHSFMVNTLGLRPPVPSIFEDGFRG